MSERTTNALTPQQRVTAYWDFRGGDAYDRQPSHSMRDSEVWSAWSAAVARVLPDDRTIAVLDVGTGTGFLALLAADLGYHVTGIDLSAGMLATASEHFADHPNPATLLQGDAIQPDFPPQSFDIIMNRHLLWTLVEPDAAARSWFQLLKPGGLVVAWDSLWWHAGYFAPTGDEARSPVADAWGHYYGDETLDELPLARAATPDALIYMFERAGFTDVRIETDPAADRAHRNAAASDRKTLVPPTLAITARKPSP